MSAPKGNRFGEKNKGRKNKVDNRDSGSSVPRIKPDEYSCGLCGEKFSRCAGHKELPGKLG